MNISSAKKIIESLSPAVTGVITSLIIFIYRLFNGAKQYEYAIPLICGGLCTIFSMLIIEKMKSNREKKKTTAVNDLVDSVKDKHTFYSELMKQHEPDSELYNIYKEKIKELLVIETLVIEQKKTYVIDLDKEINEADSFLQDGAQKIADFAQKKNDNHAS
ncbi:hypothetical protein A3N57_01645 [Enterobacter cloacae subsp. dissolvens]|uniref:hypothetical protein n=1 Tax=Enterobacter cloacae TaxID=550 RepID=UPI0007B3EEC1|nr:hypothetical protein [Enterobacter cloacae]KZQ41876.1 hypothetical protein A3N57_01645 [Enterobacter cloacae subsp. dissolvens]HBH7063416.1 hypothetical protein [Enterobacter cloacae]